MRIRRATVDDARAIAEAHVRAWQVAYRHAFPAEKLDALSVEERAARWRLNVAEQDVLVAEDAGEVVGWASAGPGRDDDTEGELYGLYVLPEAWGRGAGRALIAQVERDLGARYRDATLWVLEDNPRARRFYERAGWEHDGGRKREPFLGVEVDEVRYRKRLGAPRVLFVCVHNAGRSQMAAVLLERYGAGAIDVRSAGSRPAHELNPAVVEAMRVVGVDLAGRTPSALRDDDVRAADVVVTMGCGDACPVFPGRRYEDWELDDPSGRDATAVRRIRDEVDARVRRLAGELVGGS